jgi:hypothetical protein
MQDIVQRQDEADQYCCAITDPVRRRLVRWWLNMWIAPLTMLGPAEFPSMDMLILVQLLEAMTIDLALVVALAEGAPLPATKVIGDPVGELVARAAECRRILHVAEALRHAHQIADPATRNLVLHGLASSLTWLLDAYGRGAHGARFDLLLHARMLTHVFAPTHAIAHVAAGKPDGPWLAQ